MIRAAIALAAALFASPVAAVGVGDPAPPLRATALDGSEQSLDQLRGRVVYVDFWASWCAPCLQALPHYQRVWRELEARGLTVLGVSLDSEGVLAQRALTRSGVTFPVIPDPAGRWATAFALPAMPTSYAVDRAGVVRYVQTGFHPGDEKNLRAVLLRLLAETP